MNRKIYFVLLIVFAAMAFVSCDKDDDDVPDSGICSEVWAEEVQDELNAVMTAAQTYASSPTTENCLAYKAAAQAYVDALEPYAACAGWAGATRAEWEAALEEAQASVDSIECD